MGKAFLKIQRELESIYMESLLWMQRLKKDPIHEKIMQTRDAFVYYDDSGMDEIALKVF